MVVCVVVMVVLSGCTTPTGNVAIARFPNGLEIGSARWGNAGLGVTNTQHTNLHGTIDKQNSQWHNERVQHENSRNEEALNKHENSIQKVLAKLKTSVVKTAIKTGAGASDVTTIMGAGYGKRDKTYLNRRELALMKQYNDWKVAELSRVASNNR